MLELSKQFRPATSHTYPPFKNGRYMEEYVYEFFLKNSHSKTYIPIFWTNMQNHPGFKNDMRPKYNKLLQTALKNHATSVKPPKYFTIVQHDDGPLLELPPGTIVFGASTGTVPLPLIYEDVSERLLKEPRIKKDLLASFVGSMTHPIREVMIKAVDGKDGIICQGKNGWNAHISDDLADVFIKLTLRSKFCLAPRGYGRSSFRFFEAMQLDTIPVYIWDDICWLPYQDVIDYSTFSVLIHKDDIHKTYEILSSISDGKYEEMQRALREVRHKFTLEWMCNYIHHFL